MGKKPERAVPSVAFVAEHVDVECPVGVVRERLASGGEWLLPLAHHASSDGEGIVVRLRHPGVGRAVPIPVCVRTGECTPIDAGVVIAIRWEAEVLSALFPLLDGNLEITSLGPTTSRLALHASYRPPLETFGMLADRALLHVVAASTIRSFLKHAAEVVARDETIGAAQAATTPPSLGERTDPSKTNLALRLEPGASW